MPFITDLVLLVPVVVFALIFTGVGFFLGWALT